MRLFLLVLCFSTLAWARPEPIALELMIPGMFAIKPALDTVDDGMIVRVWLIRGEEFATSPQMFQFISLPITSGETVAMQVEASQKDYESKKCKTTVRDASAPILAKGRKPMNSKTTEKILTVNCGPKGMYGVYRFVQGNEKHGGGIYTATYMVKTGHPMSPPIEEIEKRLLEMAVVLEKDWPKLKK